MSPENPTWRTLLTGMLALLMALPLGWLLYVSMFRQDTNVHGSQGKAPVPMLSPEKRRSLLTYERDCDTDADCEPPSDVSSAPARWAATARTAGA
jgi:hypothetical protein